MLSLSLNPKLAQKSSDKSNKIYELAGNKDIAARPVPVAFPKT